MVRQEILWKLGLALLVLAIALVCQPLAKADSFNVAFDNSQLGSNAIVGTGTFSFSQILGDGTYALTSLTGVNINFTVGSFTFTTADISNTDLSAVLVVIYAGGTQFYFDNTGTFGPVGGSLDFANAGSSLTTEPNYFGAPPLDLYQVFGSDGSHYFGVYQSVSTPEPSVLATLFAGLIGLAVMAFLQKRLA